MRLVIAAILIAVTASCSSPSAQSTVAPPAVASSEAAPPDLSRLLYGFSTHNHNTRKKVDKALTSVKQGDKAATLQHLQYATLDPGLSDEERMTLHEVMAWLQIQPAKATR